MLDDSLFCTHCFIKFIVPILNRSDFQVRAHHIFLFEWKKEDDKLLGPLVYRLKASQSPQAVKFYGFLLAIKLKRYMRFDDFRALVPVPGSAPNRIHSCLLADELARHFDLPKLDLLERLPETKQQKLLSSKERKLQNPFRLRPKSPEEITTYHSTGTDYIFVDDVLTTGQSVKHAESLLNDSKRNVVATLFYRPEQHH